MCNLNLYGHAENTSFPVLAVPISHLEPKCKYFQQKYHFLLSSVMTNALNCVQLEVSRSMYALRLSVRFCED